MLTSVHSAADVRIYEKEARSLSAAGYRVLIVAPHSENGMNGEIEVVGVEHQGNRMRRMTRGVWDIYGRALRIDADVYHFHDPELMPVGLLLKLHGKRVVYDVHEHVPEDILDKEWIPRAFRNPVAKAARFWEKVGARAYDAIVAATPAIAGKFPPEKTFTVQNFPIVDELLAGCALAYRERPALISYVGGLSTYRGAREMVEAINLLPESLGTRLQLIGPLEPEALRNDLMKLDRQNRIEFRGRVSRLEVGRLLGMARVGLVLFHPLACHVVAQPNKLFEYMSTGIPVVASDFPLWRETVHRVGCGLVADPLDPGAIAQAVRWLLEHPEEAERMGRRGLEAVKSRYNWESESHKLLQLYACLTDGTQTECRSPGTPARAE
jgi:glycosyltransferase involved in cell wall biosynthesis